jgi:hypothetical protein
MANVGRASIILEVEVLAVNCVALSSCQAAWSRFVVSRAGPWSPAGRAQGWLFELKIAKQFLVRLQCM